MDQKMTLDTANMKNTNSILIKTKQFLIDLKYLVKGKVLVANVLPVFTAFWLALYFNDLFLSEQWALFFRTILGSTLVIAGALMINNWYEVDLDKKMKRTENRPTVNGHFSLRFVLWLGIITSTLGMIFMLMTTIEAALYSFIGWFVYVFLYTFWSKRKFAFNTIIGSVSGMVTPLIGWAAVDSALHTIPITWAILLFIWQVPHTLAITIKRLDDYKAAGVPMLPIVKGVKVTKWHNLIYIICLLPVSLLFTPLSWGVVVFAVILNIFWIILAAKGFHTTNEEKWAQANLRFSLIYLILLSLIMIYVTL